MIYDPAYDTLLSFREAANHIKDGAKVYGSFVICHGDKPVVLQIDPALLLAALQADPEQDAESQFFADHDGDLWLAY